ncbi:MAG: GNAT family N-acetyltransferase [bacterium]
MKPSGEPILILHHAIPAPGSCQSVESDAGVMDEVQAVAKALDALSWPARVAAVESLSGLPTLLQNAKERLIFNLVENFPGRPADAMQVPTVCEAFGKECTGNDSTSQVLALDKWRTKAVLKAANLPVPAGVIIPPDRRSAASYTLPPPPWIVKPLFADASEGIHASSVIPGGLPALMKAVARVHRDFKHPALVEQFFGTREINISVFQDGNKVKTLPIAEIEFRGYGKNRPHIVDYAAKWHTESFEYKNTVRVIPAILDKAIARRLSEAALAAWHTMGCRDYARVDFRLDENGHFVILEINPNPDISPDSGFAAALAAAKIPYPEFVKRVCHNAQARLALNTTALPPASPLPEAKRNPRRLPRSLIRHTLASDRDAILDFMHGTSFFHEGEITVAREVLEEAIAKGPADHYQSFTLLDGGRPSGWICYGPTPCTEGTFDIYWIGVRADGQGRGFGRALLDHVEKLIRRKKGRLILIETSGRPLYHSTRGFYLKTGYAEVARIPDFYAEGDDRVVYAKSLTRG